MRQKPPFADGPREHGDEAREGRKRMKREKHIKFKRKGTIDNARAKNIRSSFRGSEVLESFFC